MISPKYLINDEVEAQIRGLVQDPIARGLSAVSSLHRGGLKAGLAACVHYPCRARLGDTVLYLLLT